MAWTNEEILEKLGTEAQVVPGAIMVFRGKHIVVAELTVGGGFVITPEGMDILGAAVVVKALKKPKKAVESANTSVDVTDDFDLED